MEYIVLGIVAVRREGMASQVVDIAAILIDKAGQEREGCQMYVNPGVETLKAISPETAEAILDGAEAHRSIPSDSDAAAGLRAFLDRHPQAVLHAFNMDRARRLLVEAPWNIKDRWGGDIRNDVLDVIQSRGEAEESEASAKGLKLYDGAKAMNVPAPLKRSAISDARVSAEILVKIKRMKDTMTSSDRNFLLEAIHLMEDGL